MRVPSGGGSQSWLVEMGKGAAERASGPKGEHGAKIVFAFVSPLG
jgi:hypothetical protein